MRFPSEKPHLLLLFVGVLLLFEVVFGYAAEGANPIGGDVLEGGAGGYAAFRVASGGVIDVAANFAYILFHRFLFYRVNCLIMNFEL